MVKRGDLFLRCAIPTIFSLLFPRFNNLVHFPTCLEGEGKKLPVLQEEHAFIVKTME